MSKAQTIASCLELAESCIRDARLLLAAESRNAAYLASQAAEHVIKAVATSEDLHIDRKDAHQLDTIVRRIPAANPDREALASISFLEAYATSYRYGTPTGRIPVSPPVERISVALQRTEALIAVLREHFGPALDARSGERRIDPRR